MANYRIVCTDQEPINQPRLHAHIVAVGIGNDPNRAERQLKLRQVLSEIDRGHTFYTKGVRSGCIAKVVAVVGCPVCSDPRRIIRSAPDAVEDNNLDYLRRCQWRSA